MAPLWSLILVAVSGIQVTDTSHPRSSALHHLTKKLLQKYHKEVRPVHNKSEATTVYLDLFVHAVLDVDVQNQKLKTSVWYREVWDDEFLSWNTSMFDDIRELSLPLSAIWAPDIIINEFVDIERSPDLPYVYVNSSGTIKNTKPIQVVSACSLETYAFPFDIQNCSLTFNSILHTVEDIDLAFLRSQEDIKHDKKAFLNDSEWELLSVPSTYHILQNSAGDFAQIQFNDTYCLSEDSAGALGCIPQGAPSTDNSPYEDMRVQPGTRSSSHGRGDFLQYIIGGAGSQKQQGKAGITASSMTCRGVAFGRAGLSKVTLPLNQSKEKVELFCYRRSQNYRFLVPEQVVIRRRPLVYVVSLLIPSIFLMLVDLGSFYLPPNCRARIVFKTGVLVGYTVFRVNMSDEIPRSAVSTPLIGIFFTVCMAFLVLSLSKSILLIKFLHDERCSGQARPLLCLQGDTDADGTRMDPKVQLAEITESPIRQKHQVQSGTLKEVWSQLQTISDYVRAQEQADQQEIERLARLYRFDRLLFRSYIIVLGLYIITLCSLWALWSSL